MTTKETSGKKSAVRELTFGAKTAKRVAWESWEFTVVGPHLVKVTNASYGYLKEDHAYTVGVEERDGRGVPAECDCPADVHHESDCKHKVAVATIGGKVLLDAAVNFSAPSEGGRVPAESVTVADKLRADGGSSVVAEACPNGQVRCGGPEDDELPCFACYSGNRSEA
ncbi:SWIM zinc finger family protein [Halorussus caseinilyticus]|uniref:SWIM zinc finger family protein n=1 Tax=Halorussus caseinilyticus TaxID=3034025 RepID=A0ABD5WK97_9EURY|nr:SWIM zinc finger family protein [Halorussus sp. DT72]